MTAPYPYCVSRPWVCKLHHIYLTYHPQGAMGQFEKEDTIDNRTLQLYRDSLEQTEDQIAGLNSQITALNKRATSFREEIAREMTSREAKARNARNARNPKPTTEAQQQ